MKSNKQFMLLSALGILFVVDAHSGIQLAFLTNIFPYDSFYMPMFVFISGYFFNKESIAEFGKYFIKKVKNLLIPYFLWNVFYGITVYLLKAAGYTHWGANLTFNTIFVTMWQTGESFELNGASWFIPMLFTISIVYVLLRKSLNKIWNEFLCQIALILCGALSVYLCTKGYNVNPIYLLPLKVMFFLQFYQLGILYKKYFEKYINSKKILFILPSTILINIFLILIYGSAVNFVRCATMTGFNTNNYFLPLITSVPGILFWSIIAKLLVPVLGNNKLINYISDNTISIMIHHLLFFNILNALLYYLNKYSYINGFDRKTFISSTWYKYMPIDQIGIIYFIFGIFGSLIICCCINLMKTKIRAFKSINIKKRHDRL